MAKEAQRYYIQRLFVTIAVMMVILACWLLAYVTRQARRSRQSSILNSAVYPCPGIDSVSMAHPILAASGYILGRPKISLHRCLALIASHISSYTYSTKWQRLWTVGISQDLLLSTLLAAILKTIRSFTAMIELCFQLLCVATATRFHVRSLALCGQ